MPSGCQFGKGEVPIVLLGFDEPSKEIWGVERIDDIERETRISLFIQVYPVKMVL